MCENVILITIHHHHHPLYTLGHHPKLTILEQSARTWPAPSLIYTLTVTLQLSPRPYNTSTVFSDVFFPLQLDFQLYIHKTFLLNIICSLNCPLDWLDLAPPTSGMASTKFSRTISFSQSPDFCQISKGFLQEFNSNLCWSFPPWEIFLIFWKMIFSNMVLLPKSNNSVFE